MTLDFYYLYVVFICVLKHTLPYLFDINYHTCNDLFNLHDPDSSYYSIKSIRLHFQTPTVALKVTHCCLRYLHGALYLSLR